MLANPVKTPRNGNVTTPRKDGIADTSFGCGHKKTQVLFQSDRRTSPKPLASFDSQP
jgi:hypothetical protein